MGFSSLKDWGVGNSSMNLLYSDREMFFFYGDLDLLLEGQLYLKNGFWY